jgi:hypothetical protein
VEYKECDSDLDVCGFNISEKELTHNQLDKVAPK